MKTNLDCVYCIIQKAGERYEKFNTDPSEKLLFMKKVFQLIGSSSEDVTAPFLSKCVNDLLKQEFGVTDEYKELKSHYNKQMLELEDRINHEISLSDDPLLSALQFAMIGNFIDFGAMDTVDPNKLNELIQSSETQTANQSEYRLFREELKTAKTLVYLLDNAGEIVFDKICMETIKNLYPNVRIRAVVRGFPVFNDATMQDALEVGLDKVADIMDNGTDIPGTQLDRICKEARNAVEQADVIISKGQGNFETLSGCEKNVYYMFLCKCDLFVRRFEVPQFSGLFVNEHRLEV
jgi:uncharacterized protein with ATP-grasp and redox domains